MTIHDNETSPKTTVGNATEAFLDKLEADLGTSAKAVLSSLAQSLDDLAERLSSIRADLIDQKNQLDLSASADTESIVRIPPVDLPDLVNIQKQINQYLPVGTSPEINELHNSTAQARIVRDPENIRRFERRKDGQIRASLQLRIQDIGKALTNVNVVRNAVRERL